MTGGEQPCDSSTEDSRMCVAELQDSMVTSGIAEIVSSTVATSAGMETASGVQVSGVTASAGMETASGVEVSGVTASAGMETASGVEVSGVTASAGMEAASDVATSGMASSTTGSKF